MRGLTIIAQREVTVLLARSEPRQFHQGNYFAEELGKIEKNAEWSDELGRAPATSSLRRALTFMCGTDRQASLVDVEGSWPPPDRVCREKKLWLLLRV